MKGDKFMADWQIILEEAAYARQKVQIKTKNRGIITGMFEGVDEYDTDPDRLGFFMEIGKHEGDTVFLDEIVEITKVPKRIPKSSTIYASGK